MIESVHLVDTLGAYMHITTPWGTFNVPRHYIVTHGIIAGEVHKLFERVS